MSNNGVGFAVGQVCLVFNGEGAPWPSGWYDKICYSYKRNYNNFFYVSKKEAPTIIVLLEGLIRWQDE